MGQAEDGSGHYGCHPGDLGTIDSGSPSTALKRRFPASLWDPVARVREIAEPSTVATR